jgi:hypothetical protein
MDRFAFPESHLMYALAISPLGIGNRVSLADAVIANIRYLDFARRHVEE